MKSLYSILEKYIKAISDMFENNIAAVKVGKLRSPKEHRKGNERPRNQMERKNSPGLRLC